MDSQEPEHIDREWLQQWMGNRFPAVVLHQEGHRVGYYLKENGVEGFERYYSWRAVYNYLKEFE